MAAEGSTKAIVAALFANLGIAIAKFVGFLLTRSASMLAESVHSVADTSNQGLLLLGGRRARRPATPEHPFGFGRERYFWSFVVALVLFSLGSMFALYEGYQKLRHPHEVDSPEIAIGILLVGIALESYSLWTAIVESNKVRGSAGWWSFIRNSRIPELPVVLLEDIGAMVGLVLALLAVIASAATGDPVYDAIGTMSIGVLLFVIAVILMIEMKGMLIGEAATGEQQRTIHKAIEASPHVNRLIHMRTQHLGPDELFVGAKVELAEVTDLPGVASAIDEVEQAIRTAVPSAKIVYVEPDVGRATG